MAAPTAESKKNALIVGAAIGRPSAKIRSDVKQNSSAKATIAIVHGRADAKAFI